MSFIALFPNDPICHSLNFFEVSSLGDGTETGDIGGR